MLPMDIGLMITIGVLSCLLASFLLVRFYLVNFRPRTTVSTKTIANFKKGKPQNINSKLPLNDRSYLMPYKIGYEFPKKKIEFGEHIFFGTFGLAYEGVAQGILRYEGKTAVTIKKMVPMTANEVAHAMISELKVLVYTQKHLYLVNLLGAVTKNIKRREVIILLEYCPFGNLKKFLWKHRGKFINQINPRTDIIDLTITASNRPKPNNAQQSSTVELADTRSVSTTDLLCWSFQILRGMQHLAAHTILHKHLCAENVMLCDDNVVKICNFGLPQTFHRPDQNLKQLFKWQALEVLQEQRFSIYSDVWSFGILLWELFALGDIPYYGMNSVQELYGKLNDGYRMKQPNYANEDIYEIMYSCWHVNPKSRPLFDALEKSVTKLLTKDMSEHYIALNEYFLKANGINVDPDQPDYLAGITALDHMDTSIPTYTDNNEKTVTVDLTDIRPISIPPVQTIDNPLLGISIPSTEDSVQLKMESVDNPSYEVNAPSTNAIVHSKMESVENPLYEVSSPFNVDSKSAENPLYEISSPSLRDSVQMKTEDVENPLYAVAPPTTDASVQPTTQSFENPSYAVPAPSTDGCIQSKTESVENSLYAISSPSNVDSKSAENPLYEVSSPSLRDSIQIKTENAENPLNAVIAPTTDASVQPTTQSFENALYEIVAPPCTIHSVQPKTDSNSN